MRVTVKLPEGIGRKPACLTVTEGQLREMLAGNEGEVTVPAGMVAALLARIDAADNLRVDAAERLMAALNETPGAIKPMTGDTTQAVVDTLKYLGALVRKQQTEIVTLRGMMHT